MRSLCRRTFRPRRSLAAVVGLAVLAGACSQALVDGDAGRAPGYTPHFPDAPSFPDAAPLPALSVDYADPNHGSFEGGTEVTLRGRGFTTDMVVTFGDRAVDPADLQVLDAQRAIVKTPAGHPGPAPIEIKAGGENARRDDGFSYDSLVIEPTNGAIAGGTFVRIRGLGTAFDTATLATLDGNALTGVVVVNAQELTGYTPPGEPGTATLSVTGAPGQSLVVPDAYTYMATTDAYSGGLGGGPVNGTLNLTVIDNYTQNGIPMAYVVIGDPATSPFHGYTDPFGEIVLSAPGLAGPLTVTAGHPKYESGAFVNFDAQNATMFLTPLPPDPTDPPPDNGPAPPGRSGGTVSGDIVFGGATSIGTDSSWPLVPEPVEQGQVKRTYVFTTARDIFGGSADPGPGGTVDFSSGPTGWHYQIPVRPSAFALVAIAGIYNATDPDGPGPLQQGTFTPYAMGVLRGLVAGPGQDLANVAIPINIPLDTAIIVRLKDAPALTPGTGPDQYQVSALIDLGGEGVIRLPGSHATWSDKPEVLLSSLAPIGGALSDASYTFVAGTYTAKTFSPYSARILRGVRDLSAPVVIDGFVGVVRAVDPPDNGTSVTHHLVVAADGGTATPTFYYHRLQTADGIPVFRVFARGDTLEAPLYDLTGGGLPPLTNAPLTWAVTAISVPGGRFDTFKYNQLNANLWDAYAAASFDISFP
jgi:hypothetical protein